MISLEMELGIEGKKITVYQAERPCAPLLIMNSYNGNGASVVEAPRQMTDRDFSLVNISGLNWDDDMTPWPCPPITENDTACSGKASSYLKQLEEEILPVIWNELGKEAVWTGIIGYSLGGLFALWALTQTDAFRRAASVSGSLWYPDFVQYAEKTTVSSEIEKIYLSLGDRESRTDNRYLSTTEANTRTLQKWYAEQGIESVFELNPGDHLTMPAKRMGKAAAWILKEQA